MVVYILVEANPDYEIIGPYSSLDNAKDALFILDEDCRNSGSWVDGPTGDLSLFSNDDGSEMGYYIFPMKVDYTFNN